MERNDSEKYTLSQDEFNNMNSEEKILKIAKGFDIRPGKPEEQVLSAIFDKADNKESSKIIWFNRYLQAAAAVIFIILGIYTFSKVFSKEKMTTGFAEHTHFNLPDGTQVDLNAGSKITWDDNDFLSSRQLKLKGEAYFDVEKGSKFLIKTQNGDIEILGTRLNVFSRENEFWVSCFEGKVKVTSGNSEQIITPGEVAELEDSRVLKYSKNNINQTISWQHGTFYFEDKPLVSIFDALERQFNISIWFEGNKNRSMTVVFSNNNLEEALDVICIPMGLKYEINNRKVHISEVPG